MRRKVSYLLTLVLICGVAGQIFCSPAFAADPDKYDPENLYFKEAQKARQKSARDANQQRGYVGITQEATIPGDMLCAPDDEECKNLNLPKAFKNQSRANAFSVWAPMQGFTLGMNAEQMKEQTSETLTTPLALYYIALQMTEPAVATGFNNAVQRVGFDLNNRYQAELVFNAQLNHIPEMREQVAQLHMGCLTKQILSGQSWLYAQAQCNADQWKGLDNKKLEFPSGSSSEDKLDFTGDPNYPGQNGFNQDLCKESGDGQVMFLTDYIYERDSKDGDGFKEARKAFIKTFGDVKFVISKPDKKKAGAREWCSQRVKRQDENDRKGTDYEKGKKLTETIDERAKIIYQNLMDLMKEYCKKSDSDGQTTGAPPIKLPHKATLAERLQKDFADTDFWSNYEPGDPTNPDDLPEYGDLSLEGFAFTPVFGEMMYRLYQNLRGGNVAASQSCDKEFDRDNEYEWKKINGDDKSKIDVRIRAYLHFARRIAIGQVYSEFAAAENLVYSASSGPYGTMVRDAGLALVYDTAGTNNIHGLLGANLDKLKEWVGEVGKFQQGTVGKQIQGAKTIAGQQENAGAVDGAAGQ